MNANTNIKTRSRRTILRLDVTLARIVHHTFKGNKFVILFLYDLLPLANFQHPVILLAKCAFISHIRNRANLIK